ncbi:MAG: LPS-assembly protein LptD [Bacteroidia bacterium]|nr:LPS-assembly protein LptD [Bacteroidia bacterium]
MTWKTAANDLVVPEIRRALTITVDTIIPISKGDSLKQFLPIDTTKFPGNDSLRQKIDTFSLKISKDSLEAPLKYSAEDSVIVMIQDKKIILYGKTKTEYQDILLTAPRVDVDQQTQVVTAYNEKDSTGAITEQARFKDGESEFSSDTIRYNFKSQVGLTRNTYTENGGMFIIGDYAKKINETTTFIKKASFSTCDLDEPHFSFVADKMKIVNKKLAISGPVHPEFEGVPIPIYLPFGFFPLSQGRHSGLLPPQFANNDQYGLGLEGLGYYKVLSNYWDLKLYGNVYSYGGWSVNINPTYRKRYRYSGAFNLSMQTTKLNFKGDPDYLKNKSYFITWSHSADSRSRPGTSFSANVNAGSTKFNRLIPNNTQANFNNQLGSSITYTKMWAGKPYNLTLSANHNQNNATHLINISLPDAGFSVSTLYPFQGKNFSGGNKWYQKLGIGYNGAFRNQVSFYDTAFKLKNLLDTLQWGAQHNIPITLSLPPIFGGALIVSPSISYSQVWIGQKSRRSWNDVTKKLDTTITKGLFIDQSASFSLSFSTAIFGTYQFKKSRIIAIRHVIRPSLSLNYKPDLSKNHYYWTKVDTTDYQFRFPEFVNSLYGYYSEGQTGGIGFQLDNNLEMKWRSRKDTGENAIKKIKLIDGYGLSTGYNFLRDSLKLDIINFHLNTNLFDKFNINASTSLDPYQTNERGLDINKYAWEGGKFKLGRFTNGSLSISTSMKSKPKDAKKEEERKKQIEENLGDPILVEDQRRLLEYKQQNPSEFVDFNIPWEINLGYSLNFTNQQKPDYSGFEKKFYSNINFNGSFSLTPKWNFSLNGYYDITSHKLQTFQMAISREMHCWQLSVNVTPVGLYRSFNFSISPKASILQDLKINRSKFFRND